MLVSPIAPGGSLRTTWPPLDKVANEDKELTSEGSVSMVDEGKSWGGAKIGCAIKSGTPLKGAFGSKC